MLMLYVFHLTFPFVTIVSLGIREGDTVSVFYDPMIAKLITWDHDRNRALQQLRTALHKYVRKDCQVTSDSEKVGL